MSYDKTKLDQLDEKKASGENSVAADPVGGETPKRRADLKKKVDPVADTVKDDGPNKGPNKVKGSMTEAFGKLFDGEGLSEEFKEKTIAVFESAVNVKVNAILEDRTKDLEEEYANAIEEYKAELDEKVDNYLDMIINEWTENNSLAIESSIKVETAESLIDGMKALLGEHNINVDEDTNTMVETLEARLEEEKSKYDKLFNKTTSIKEEKDKLEMTIAFAEVSEDLTDSEAEKLETLAEGLSFSDINSYKKKLVAIKESYFISEEVTTSEDETENLEEIVEEKKNNVTSLNEDINFYAKSLNRFIG